MGLAVTFQAGCNLTLPIASLCCLQSLVWDMEIKRSNTINYSKADGLQLAYVKHGGKETGQGSSEKNSYERGGKREEKKTTEAQDVFTAETVMRAGR